MSLLKDLLTGALPITEIPAFLAYAAKENPILGYIGFCCAMFALAATGIALIVTR